MFKIHVEKINHQNMTKDLYRWFITLGKHEDATWKIMVCKFLPHLSTYMRCDCFQDVIM